MRGGSRRLVDNLLEKIKGYKFSIKVSWTLPTFSKEVEGEKGKVQDEKVMGKDKDAEAPSDGA